METKRVGREGGVRGVAGNILMVLWSKWVWEKRVSKAKAIERSKNVEGSVRESARVRVSVWVSLCWREPNSKTTISVSFDGDEQDPNIMLRMERVFVFKQVEIFDVVVGKVGALTWAFTQYIHRHIHGTHDLCATYMAKKKKRERKIWDEYSAGEKKTIFFQFWER